MEFDQSDSLVRADQASAVGESAKSPATTPVLVVARPGSSTAKRLFDLVVAALLVAFLAPLLVAIALAVAMSSRGPVLFRQQRSGLGGGSFEILKFRSMYVHTDEAVRQATRGDPRVTTIGAFLRRSSLDELPQLLNVLRGDMSLVGPRPHALAHDTRFRRIVPNYDGRFRTRPGITGLAQVSGSRGEVTTDEQARVRTEYDNAYIDQWSLPKDFGILLKTALLVVVDRNAY